MVAWVLKRFSEEEVSFVSEPSCDLSGVSMGLLKIRRASFPTSQQLSDVT